MMETYYPVHRRPVSHRDKGKWRQVLWSTVRVCLCMVHRLCLQDLFHCYSTSFSFPCSSPLVSSPLACGAIPFHLLPEGRSAPPSDQLAVDSPDSLAQDQAEEDRTNLTSKSEAERRKLLQLQERSLDFIATSLYFDVVYLALVIPS